MIDVGNKIGAAVGFRGKRKPGSIGLSEPGSAGLLDTNSTGDCVVLGLVGSSVSVGADTVSGIFVEEGGAVGMEDVDGEEDTLGLSDTEG